MSDDRDDLTRREAIRNIATGVGVLATLPVLGSAAPANDHAQHVHTSQRAGSRTATRKPEPLKFFSEAENRAVIELTERIIPADDNSPGAAAAKVNEYIDLVVSVSPDATKQTWREGLAAVDRKSQEMFGKPFADASQDQQVALLTEISKNEKSPQTAEERFFRVAKNATIDGYYTSEIGIKQELKYKGNSYLKEFLGCTHLEHQK